jgi:hypothetical protein
MQEVPMKWRLLNIKAKNTCERLTHLQADNSGASNDAAAIAGPGLTLAKKLCTGG